jgi:Stigma-specific protein, Stig1
MNLSSWKQLAGAAAILCGAAGLVGACSSSPAVIDNSDAGVNCGAGSTLCGDSCTSLATDNANCGGCGTACKGGQVCSKGACAASCGSGTTLCGATCNDTQVDPNNCGGCGTKCTAGQVCSSGKCASTCGQTQTLCGASCVNAQTDNANCGGCGTVCGQGQVCTAGKCALTCQQGLTLCTQSNADAGVSDASVSDASSDGGGGLAFPYCANVQTDNANCGGCGITCGAGQQCNNGTCTTTCGNSQTLCTGQDGGANYCSDTTSDPNNCGGCGTVCPSSNSCLKGKCVNVCNHTALFLGDGYAPSNAAYISILKTAGFTVTSSSDTTTYAGSPAANTFGVVIISPGTTFGTDMPNAGQTSIVNAQAGTTGVVMTEWAAFEVSQSRYQTLKSLILFPRTNGTTSTLQFKNTVAHPIWNGLPASFTTTVATGSNVGSVLNAGATTIATCVECNNIGVAVLDKGAGRIVQVAHAAGYNNTAWYNDPNLSLMTANAANWAARCN